MRKLAEKQRKASVVCDQCDHDFPLWDDLEEPFASVAVTAKVAGLPATSQQRLDARRKGNLLVHEGGARIASADQKSSEIPQNVDEGIDMALEFTQEKRGTGKRLYLQLKAGNAHLRRRSDGTEVFPIKKQLWVDY